MFVIVAVGIAIGVIGRRTSRRVVSGEGLLSYLLFLRRAVLVFGLCRMASGLMVVCSVRRQVWPFRRMRPKDSQQRCKHEKNDVSLHDYLPPSHRCIRPLAFSHSSQACQRSPCSSAAAIRVSRLRWSCTR